MLYQNLDLIRSRRTEYVLVLEADHWAHQLVDPDHVAELPTGGAKKLKVFKMQHLSRQQKKDIYADQCWPLAARR